jgi:hypothetical protein
MRTVTPLDREDDDALPSLTADVRGDDRRRRRWLALAALAMVAIVVLVLVLVSRSVRSSVPPAEAVASSTTPPTTSSEPVAPPSLLVPPVQASSSSMPLASPKSSSSSSPSKTPTAVRGGRRNASVAPRVVPAERSPQGAVVVDRVTGVGAAREAAEQALRRRLQKAGVASSGDRGIAVMMRVDADDGPGVARVRCGVSIARLPGRNVVGSLSARADVDGEGVSSGELAHDAGEACGATLADDLTAWLARHPD